MIFRDLALGSLRERSDYVTAAATALGLSELIVEKDFWAVWLLERLFSLSAELGPFTFKGGTSLSKGFRLIERFSEDIDVSISRTTLGFPNDAYFYETGSKAESKRRVEDIRGKVATYTADTILPRLRADLAEHLHGTKGWSLDVGEPGALRFRYPTRQSGVIGYVWPDVLIEFGHADSWPALDIEIQPYVVDALPVVTGRVPVRVLDPQRTFWEKATALHEVAHRDASIGFPSRFSRHYYDVALLGDSETARAAIANVALLEAVARFKAVFFASARARYDLAKPGSLRLMFPGFRRADVERDYERMQPMLFGAVPSFDEVCARITEIEKTINTRMA